MKQEKTIKLSPADLENVTGGTGCGNGPGNGNGNGVGNGNGGGNPFGNGPLGARQSASILEPVDP